MNTPSTQHWDVMGWKAAFHALLSRPLPSQSVVECQSLYVIWTGRKHREFVFSSAVTCVSHLIPPHSFPNCRHHHTDVCISVDNVTVRHRQGFFSLSKIKLVWLLFRDREEKQSCLQLQDKTLKSCHSPSFWVTLCDFLTLISQVYRKTMESHWFKVF